MRYRAKLDRNHTEVVNALRKAGCTVQSLATVGKGCPDLLVGREGRNWLMEVKDGESKDKRSVLLTPDEMDWFAKWEGQVAKVCSAEEALKLVS